MPSDKHNDTVGSLCGDPCATRELSSEKAVPLARLIEFGRDRSVKAGLIVNRRMALPRCGSVFAVIFTVLLTQASHGFLIPPGQMEFSLLGASLDPTSMLPEDTSVFQLNVPRQELRDQNHCESYESMVIDDDDCHIYCEVNGTIGKLEIRDPGRRTLATCKTVNNGCATCMRQIGESDSTKIFGRCGPGCTCEPLSSYMNYMQDKRECAKILNHTNFDALARKSLNNPLESPRFQVAIPAIGHRDKKNCEVYEVALSREELERTGQCRSVGVRAPPGSESALRSRPAPLDMIPSVRDGESHGFYIAGKCAKSKAGSG